MARDNGHDPLSLTDIAAREKLPHHYTEQILVRLRRAGIVKSVRGTQGGFMLAKPPSDVSVGHVIQVLEGAPFSKTCDHFNKRSNCGHLGDCSIRPVWELIAKHVWNVLDGITLKHLLEDEKQVVQSLMRQLPVLSSPSPGAGCTAH